MDGFTWRTSTGASPFGAETWTLLVDGEPVEFALWGEQNLSLAPVAITQLDSVEVWRGPRIVAGRLAHGGVIHLHTAQPQRRAEARGGFGIGNEVGDPGPYRYVPERFSPNVDKFGADYEALAGASGVRWRAQGRFKLLRFYATDAAASVRNWAAFGANPALRLFAPALRLETEALGGTHALSALGGGAKDLWFSQPLGREVPVRRLWGQLGLRGRVPVAPRAEIGYHGALVENWLDGWEGAALGLDPAWRERTARAGLRGTWRPGAWTLGLGADFRRTDANGAAGFTVGTLTAQAARTTTRGRLGLDASLAVADDVALSAALHGLQTAGVWTLGATAALTQRLPEEAGRLGFWQAQGYAGFGDALDLAQPALPRTTSEASLALDAVGRLSAHVTAEAHASVRSVRGLYLETQPAAPDPDVWPREAFALAVPDASGETGALGLALRATYGVWRGRAFYDGLAALGGSAEFERAWEAVPRHRAGATATLAPVPGFSLNGSLTYRSAARWPAYEPLTGGNGGLYDAAIPAAWLLDASVQKRLWKERLRLSLLFRNLLGQEERRHPVGATLDLRFYLRMELVL